MYRIYKITSNNVVDFAAEELKKYLRMMMPRCGEISIEYRPDAQDGFRLGVMSDFGLDTSESDDITLDDILHIDCDENGGIIAGSNPRSVLLAVYRYLTENGCRWLFPGIDGEFIPMQAIKAVKYHKMADCRYRGQCNEGAEYQPNMMEIIDFTPKIGMNVFMIEFDIPTVYYRHYYEHVSNTRYRDPEPVSQTTLLQWKRQCEAEISKRGLQYHDMGHGWTAETIGIKSAGDWVADEKNVIPEDRREFVAEINGKREFFRGVPLNTNLCMSNPRARTTMVKAIADYAEMATNVDYLHVWLADGYNNHCECENCRKKTPSDWYVMIMNELDEELERRKLNTRIVFICYVDTTYPPETERINNPKRFSLLVAPITRTYLSPVPNKVVETEMDKYVCNKLELPKTVDEYLTYGRAWTKMTGVKTFAYEYHFWRHQWYAPDPIEFAKLIYDDVRGYKINGIDGTVQDGSQRSFFPNGFSFYVYAQTLYDTSVDFETLKEDYFSHAYGEDWKEVAAFFERLGKALTSEYLAQAANRGMFYNPDMAQKISSAIDEINKFEPFVKEHLNSEFRAQTVAYRILRRYLQYCKELANIFTVKCLGADASAKRMFEEFALEFGKYELEIERWYDHFLAIGSLSGVFAAIRNVTNL